MEQANRSFYFAGDHLELGDAESMNRFVRTQAIDEESFRYLGDITTTAELREVSLDVFDLYRHKHGEARKIAGGLRISNIKWPVRRIFFMNRDANGRHRLGGLPPQGLILPSHDAMETTFQYIGMLDGTDPYFEWIGLPNVPLIFPLYEYNEGIFLDYADPLRPLILNPDTFSDDWLEIDESGWEEVLFDEVRFTVGGPYRADVPNGGVPLWQQAPQIPVCPRSELVMRFVCAIPSIRDVTIMRGHEGENLPFADEHLCFADEGTLYVFYQPASKIMHLQIQV
jgi:hypothetical protein